MQWFEASEIYCGDTHIKIQLGTSIMKSYLNAVIISNRSQHVTLIEATMLDYSEQHSVVLYLLLFALFLSELEYFVVHLPTRYSGGL